MEENSVTFYMFKLLLCYFVFMLTLLRCLYLTSVVLSLFYCVSLSENCVRSWKSLVELLVSS